MVIDWVLRRNPEQVEERDDSQSEELELNAKLANVRFFPGSQQEYEDMAGYPVEVIDIGSQDTRVLYRKRTNVNGNKVDPHYILHADIEIKRIFAEAGVEAIIRCEYSDPIETYIHTSYRYGLPVARVQD